MDPLLDDRHLEPARHLRWRSAAHADPAEGFAVSARREIAERSCRDRMGRHPGAAWTMGVWVVRDPDGNTGAAVDPTAPATARAASRASDPKLTLSRA